MFVHDYMLGGVRILNAVLYEGLCSWVKFGWHSLSVVITRLLVTLMLWCYVYEGDCFVHICCAVLSCHSDVVYHRWGYDSAYCMSVGKTVVLRCDNTRVVARVSVSDRIFWCHHHQRLQSLLGVCACWHGKQQRSLTQYSSSANKFVVLATWFCCLCESSLIDKKDYNFEILHWKICGSMGAHASHCWCCLLTVLTTFFVVTGGVMTIYCRHWKIVFYCISWTGFVIKNIYT